MVSLRLDSNNLQGRVPIRGCLSQLAASITELYLNSNQLSGPVPSEVGSLHDLQHLCVRNCD